MNAKRRRKMIILLIALAVVVGVVVVVIFWPTEEPTYQSKPVSFWFEQYAHPSSYLGAPVTITQGPNGRILRLSGTVEPLPDPAWEALKALGSNAVPYLVRRLRVSPLESRVYVQVLMNLPQAIRSKLPSPWTAMQYRASAAEALGGLGNDASPALFRAWMKCSTDPVMRINISQSLRRVHADRNSLAPVLLELFQSRYAEVIGIAEATDWQGDDVGSLFTRILQSPDPALRQQAMALLENSGSVAMPLLDQITLALADSDSEVRYLAARVLEGIGSNSPQAVAALRAALDDESAMVRNAAHRALKKFAADAIPPAMAGEAGRN